MKLDDLSASAKYARQAGKFHGTLKAVLYLFSLYQDNPVKAITRATSFIKEALNNEE